MKRLNFLVFLTTVIATVASPGCHPESDFTVQSPDISRVDSLVQENKLEEALAEANRIRDPQALEYKVVLGQYFAADAASNATRTRLASVTQAELESFEASLGRDSDSRIRLNTEFSLANASFLLGDAEGAKTRIAEGCAIAKVEKSKCAAVVAGQVNPGGVYYSRLMSIHYFNRARMIDALFPSPEARADLLRATAFFDYEAARKIVEKRKRDGEFSDSERASYCSALTDEAFPVDSAKFSDADRKMCVQAR